MNHDDSTPQKDAMQAYFGVTPDRPRLGPAVTLLGGGSILVLAGVSLSDLASPAGDPAGCAGCAGTLLAVPGFLLAASGLVVITTKWTTFQHKLRRPVPAIADADVQCKIDEAFAQATARALSASGLVRQELVSQPLVISGPVLWKTDAVPASDLVWRRGRDGVARFGIYRISTILLTESHLVAHTCLYNLIRAAFLGERTEEVHYRNIVSVSTSDSHTTTQLFVGGNALTSAREFSITVASGESLRVIVDSPQIRAMIGVERLPNSGAERAVRAIRAMLRERG